MATPAKFRLVARVWLDRPGEQATVEVDRHGTIGSVSRCGPDRYEAIRVDGQSVGVKTRYEGAVRLLARDLGILRKHTLTVKVMRTRSRRPVA